MHKVLVTITNSNGETLHEEVMELTGANSVRYNNLSPFDNVNSQHPNRIRIAEIREADINSDSE